jgi:hypothetical protein
MKCSMFSVSILCIRQMIWVWRAKVEWYWQEKIEELGEKPVQVPLCPPRCSLTLIDISVPRCGSLSVIYFFTVNTHTNQAICMYISLLFLYRFPAYTLIIRKATYSLKRYYTTHLWRMWKGNFIWNLMLVMSFYTVTFLIVYSPPDHECIHSKPAEE